jgi:glycosyltransferase involved in cell wall biosynthesis
MRILFVVNTLPPSDVSGVGEQVLQLAEGLKAQGHRVEILGRGKTGASGPKILFPLMIVRPFLEACRNFRPDLVQVHESDGAFAALALKTVSAILDSNPRLVALLQVSYLKEIQAVRTIRWNGQQLGSPSANEWIFRWFKGPLQFVLGCLTGWLADLVLAPSIRTAGELERDYRLSNVRVLPNVTSSLARSEVPKLDGFPARDFLLFVGRLRIRKGVEILLHAMTTGGDKDPETLSTLVIVGDGEHRESLELKVRDLHLQDRVIFVGRRSREEIAEFMSRASALVVPSIYEGMPLVILEAMSRGLPIVASRVSGIPEVVVDGESGWLVEPENVDQLARALDSLSSSRSEARRRGQAGQSWVSREANPRMAARRWVSLVSGFWPSLAQTDRMREEGSDR